MSGIGVSGIGRFLRANPLIATGGTPAVFTVMQVVVAPVLHK